ncbi:hypothetical protein OVA13_12375 [Pseudoxanthomonas sp. SL93]|uniref:M56 family metallopeptidase n=1 Tax=Pseudoxanthomonas sp. SL93 TaxID=2995142 RepID=UPI00227187AB|nr:M56 family metallopeptidase [Pseudoxanthomonas sp. SL93]WAC62191.1 hypothetical protein OVA13_12375 [Pseudoxanthomonas sp. SL93]
MDLISLADVVLSRLLAVSAQSLVLAALVWALCRYLPRLDASTRCWLWWLVATQMVVGLLWTSPVPLPLLPAEPAPVMAVATAGLSGENLAIAPLAASAVSTASPDVGATAWQLPSWPVVLLFAWAAGVGVMLMRTLHAWVQLRRRVARSRPCTDRALCKEYVNLGEQLGIARLPALRTSDDIDSPQLVGPIEPVLLLPSHQLARMGADDLRMALHHELTHLQRRDLWWSWMPVLAQHLFFFHPVAHLAAREYGFAREVACDAAVIADERHAPHDYGRLLVKLGVATAPAPALAGASPTFRILKRRLLMLQHTASPLRASALALTLGVVLLGVVPYRVTASSAPAAPAAPPAPAAPAPVARPTVAPQPDPAAAPDPVAAPGPIRVARAADMPAPPAPPSPPATPTVVAPAPPAPPPPPALSLGHGVSSWSIRNGGDSDDSYILINGKHVTMNGDSDDIRRVKQLQQDGQPLLWIRQDGKQYVVRDAATLKRLAQAHAPVEALGEQQGALGEKQGALGERQGELGERQGELGMKMAELASERVERAMREARDGQTSQEQAHDRRMDALSKEQEALARQQEALARQQEPLARQQEALARKQEAASVAMQREVERVISEAIRNGTAQRL